MQDTRSVSRICFESPSESVQEPRSTVDVALVVALDFSAFPATDSFPAISSTVWAAPREQGFWEKDVCL